MLGIKRLEQLLRTNRRGDRSGDDQPALRHKIASNHQDGGALASRYTLARASSPCPWQDWILAPLSVSRKPSSPHCRKITTFSHPRRRHRRHIIRFGLFPKDARITYADALCGAGCDVEICPCVPVPSRDHMRGFGRSLADTRGAANRGAPCTRLTYAWVGRTKYSGNNQSSIEEAHFVPWLTCMVLACRWNP